MNKMDMKYKFLVSICLISILLIPFTFAGANIEGNLNITQTDTSAAIVAMNIIQNSSSASAFGINVDTSDNDATAGRFFYSTNKYVSLVRPNTAGVTNYFYRNLASADTAGALVSIKQDNAGDDQSALLVTQDAPSIGIEIVNNQLGYIASFTDNFWGVNGAYTHLGRKDASGYNLFYRSLNSTQTNASLVYIYDASTLNNQPGLKVQVLGTGKAIEVWNATARTAYIEANGTMYAKGFVDATPGFIGDVKEAIQKHRTVDGKIDDDNLDDFMKSDWDIPIVEEQYVLRNGEIKQEKVITGYEKKTGRNIGNTLTVAVDAIKDLYDEINMLKGEIALLKNELCKKDSYSFC